MDIVSRLKKFINAESVPVTQFADNCKIPRPTLSQLLNGRNKKVSDELITKIHDAYPNLSVLWLMFGEGNMLTTENIQTSEPQTASIFGFQEENLADAQQFAPSIDFEKNFTENDADNSNPPQGVLPGINSAPISVSSSSEDAEKEKSTITFNPYSKKRIVNIIVYYDDNSFESFVPGPRK
ncbi:MAG: helix-turn-helix domain-containing protein [Firmicutes bacterium]|nr:helix-turn-helix domain-containing protein [Bacillota bacterium]MCM1401573.1 helix-turn-helix domain-containing protein [Bacteroides sp.]MCM1477267.1 helix-turn-helix domain-containing protein [Bacteroides sp.]